MVDYRIDKHPILPVEEKEFVEFFWGEELLKAQKDEMISSALFANGIRIFGHHHKDNSPQGIFCANGQCAQCMVLANGKPVKSCMTPVQEGMKCEPMNGLPELPVESAGEDHKKGFSPETFKVPVLIIGGGPAGMSAAIQLGKLGVKTLLVDDKNRLGGKLVLQTHRFFGSINAVYAGTRGIDIATRLENQVKDLESVQVWLNSTALAVYSDKTVSVLKDNEQVQVIQPEVLLVTAGAREKSLIFKGNTLPGVYGAGAFQTLVNRDLVRPSKRLFIVGGGNVGLIAAYHALQAGIEVVGLVEALPECGGYKVHKDKLQRFGVPIYTSHTILSANGQEQVDSITIAQIDKNFKAVPGTEKSFYCDTILIAVGLDPINEFTLKAGEFEMQVFSAGDSEEIAEASSAMFSGKIKGMEIARLLGAAEEEVPGEWYETAKILKSHPGARIPERIPERESGVFPIFHCAQEIPCNPCTSVCPQQLIHIDEEDIRHIPEFLGEHLQKECIGCEKCVTICPGLAITLVDYRKDSVNPTVTLAYEFSRESIQVGNQVKVLDAEGNILGEVPVSAVRAIKANDRTIVLKLQAPADIAKQIAGIQVQESWVSEPLPEALEPLEDETIVCRCERVSAGEIRELIRQGHSDMNDIKAITRAGMGACGGKTCGALIQRLFREEGIPSGEIVDQVKRPLFVEVPLGSFRGEKQEQA